MRRKILFVSFSLFSVLCSLFSYAYAKEVNILFTGETHAMLYPCSCPKEPDGGIARRAALVGQLRRENPATLLLDSGAFFAGGIQDEYSQNTQLDMERTRVNLKAIELMQYDALAVGDDEFNFGVEFLKENIKKSKAPFLSCNLSLNGQTMLAPKPYIIKKIAGVKFGLIGVTNILAAQKFPGLKFIEPKIAVQKAVEDLKKNKADIIILLSHLGESDDLDLIRDVAGIDILITGHSRQKKDISTQIGTTLVLRPSWQGRRVGRLSLRIQDNKIADYRVEGLRLSDKIKDDPEILSILPVCFSENNCKKEGFIGKCEHAGTLKSRCAFAIANKIPLTVIMPKDCRVCMPEGTIKYLKGAFPGLTFSYLNYPDDIKAVEIVKDFGIKALPAYLLGKEADGEEGFAKIKDNLEVKGSFYMLKPNFSGISYFLSRKKIPGKFDLFISLYDKGAVDVLKVVREFNPDIHFLAIEREGAFQARNGIPEVEESLRSVCVQKYYPEAFWDYLACRAKDINSQWQACLTEVKANKIKACVGARRGSALLRRNIRLNKELSIMFGPTYLIDEEQIFAFEGPSSKEELKKILKR